MVKITGSYTGNKKCSLNHPEGSALKTDAPKDIGGEASAFSPTDLIAAGLATCVLTTIGMFCERHGIDVSGAKVSIEKHMTSPPLPRKIAALPCIVDLPNSVPPEMRQRVENAGNTCPVKATLPADLQAPITYRYV